ncbi:sensor histidine kinase [Carnobacterium divergens]|uniref:sensor histidine kinase n=1 Tax=Carnobacterium divergens TaxID=2748 RepID=UPI0039B0504B
MKNTIQQKQQIRFFIYNVVTFAIIFLIFGLIIYQQVQNSLYSSVNSELLKQKERLDNVAPVSKEGIENQPDLPKNMEQKRQGSGPGILPIEWNKKGEILNQDAIGELNYALFNQLTLDTTKLGTVKSVTVGDSSYRYIVFKAKNSINQDAAYIQFIISVKAEEQLAASFGEILIVCSIVFWILSILASYVLARKSMRPILLSWQKQTEFVENASHELRTPLTIIQNKLEGLLTKPNERIVDEIEPIALSLSEIRHLSKLTSDLLWLSRADSNQTLLTKEPVLLNDFLAECLAPYQEIAASQGKYFWTKLASPMIAEVDKTRIQQVLVILLDNALKYTKEKETIGLGSFVEGNYWELMISDTGSGIAKENQERVFERFFREEKSRNRGTGGTGLGLPIAKWIVELHQGKIELVENTPKGCLFKVRIPLT